MWLLRHDLLPQIMEGKKEVLEDLACTFAR